MSQQVLRLAHVCGRQLRPSVRLVTTAAVGSTRLGQTASPNTRSLTQRAAVQSLQLAEAPKQQDNYYNDNMLLVSSQRNLLPLTDMRKSADFLHYSHTGKTVTEQLSIMQSCLANGYTEQAQRILVGMYQLYPQAMHEVVDVTIHNEILYGLLTAKPRALVQEVLEWYEIMENRYGIVPNSNTFAILINGFVNNNMQNVALALMQEMLRNGHTIHGMLLSNYLSDEDIRKIEAMAKDVVKQGNENSELAAMLLKEVKKAEENVNALADEVDRSEGSFVDIDSISEISKSGSTATKRAELDSTNVAGIKQLRSTLESLYSNELRGYNLQVRLENDTYDAALERYREINSKRNDPLLMGDVGKLKLLSASWLLKLETLIAEEQQRCKVALNDQNDRERAAYGRFFIQLDASKMATIVILETLRLSAASQRESYEPENVGMLKNKLNGGLVSTTLINKLSSAIHKEIRFEQIKKRSNRHVFGHRLSLARLATSGKLFNMTIRRAKMREHQQQNSDLFLDEWSTENRIRIGSLLVSMLIESARLPEKYIESGIEKERMVPAFKHDLIFAKGRRHGVVIAHSNLIEMLTNNFSTEVVNSRHLPMLVPPRPWLTYNSGGYLTDDEPCMRTKHDPEQMRLLRTASNEDRLSTMLAGLDALGMTKWAINRQVFESVRKVWNSGCELAEIPAKSYDAPEPTKPADYDTNKAAQAKYWMEMREWRNGRANQHSQRCDCNYKIEIAQAFLDHPMYFPHNMDFRGRAYPIPPHFNHLGNDMCRGLLVFHEGRPLTEKGLYWLKIHLANLFGKDKLSHNERIQFVEDNLEGIAASADNPVPDSLLSSNHSGDRPLWLSAESPWQALAACIELTAAMRSPNPAEFVSHLHIHQDGTCNGLQHYAAMGRDRKGAEGVNLAMSDRPQDVYSGILRVAERLVNEDAKRGVEEALLLQNRLTRKIVKQTVMTNVYGVTLIGAKEQISARLREVKDENGQHVFDITKVHALGLYMARKIFASLGEMFTQAQEIQNWLNESARRISSSMSRTALAEAVKMAASTKSSAAAMRHAVKDASQGATEMDHDQETEIHPDCEPGLRKRKQLEKLAEKPMTPVAWTTPLGLTVVQPYRKLASRRIITNLQTINIRDLNMPSQVNSQKQKTAFPPNFVHSLDASHMVMSAIECKIAGLVFSSVHDSYWTHACDVDKMNSILREQFVKLHKTPIMENLKAEFEQRYKDHMLPMVVWEYATSFSFNRDGTLKSEKRRLAKSAREKRDKQIESDLARYQLGDFEGDAEAAASEVNELAKKQIEANEAKLSESFEPIDLSAVELIDPKKDLEGAARQADLIAYSLRVNRTRVKKERAEILKTYRSRINKLRKFFKQLSSAQDVSNIRRPVAVAPADVEAVRENRVTSATLETYIESVIQEKEALLNELETKYPTSFDKTIDIKLFPTEDGVQIQKLEQLISQGKLAGRLVKTHQFVELKFQDLPARGDFDIDDVLRSPYFFS
ncbi:DNA-directed RNA polymerase [Coemansia sp. RSA 1085]|nr:DNA-directed RNA polymerase [Coemansia sp. RSA 1085]